VLLVELHTGLGHEYGFLSAERCTVRHRHLSEDLVETDLALVLSRVLQDSGSGSDAGSKCSLRSISLFLERSSILTDSNLSPDTVLPSSAAKSENSTHHVLVSIVMMMSMHGAAGSSYLSAGLSDLVMGSMECFPGVLSFLMSTSTSKVLFGSLYGMVCPFQGFLGSTCSSLNSSLAFL